MKQDWENFKKAIKQARRDSGLLFGFPTLRFVTVTIEERDRTYVFELNPFCVNLQTGLYDGLEKDLVSGKWICLPNLKGYFWRLKLQWEKKKHIKD